MSSRGANVTVTIGAAFAGSFKSVLREADRELKNFGKRGSRTMKGFDKAAKGAGKSVAATAKAAREAGSAIGALHRELPALRTGAKHTATAAREMRTLARDTREATKAQRPRPRPSSGVPAPRHAPRLRPPVHKRCCIRFHREPRARRRACHLSDRGAPAPGCPLSAVGTPRLPLARPVAAVVAVAELPAVLLVAVMVAAGAVAVTAEATTTTQRPSSGASVRPCPVTPSGTR